MLGLMYENGEGGVLDFNIAMDWYIRAGNNGHTEAQYSLGMIYHHGKYGVLKDYELSISWLQKAVEVDNNPSVQCIIGNIYNMGGYGIEKDPTLSRQWYLKSANQGNNIAQMEMGLFYFNGTGVEKDYNESIIWLQKSVNQSKDSEIQFKIGFIYETGGYGIEQDYKLALHWYSKSVMQDNISAKKQLGIMYFEGTGVDKNFEKSLFYFQNANISETDHDSQYKLGFMYDNGEYGIDQNSILALEWYTKSAINGNTVAQYKVGLFYRNGLGVEKDYKEAAMWFEKAADQDVSLDIGYLYQSSVKKAYREAISSFKKSAKNDVDLDFKYGKGYLEKLEKNYEKEMSLYKVTHEDEARVNSQYNMGYIYQHGGYGIQKDYTMALNWYTKSAIQGNTKAQRVVASFYFNGLGVEKKYKDALYWYKKVLEDSDDVDAQNNIGFIHLIGDREVEKDYSLALYWYTKSADQGSSKAQYQIGRLYRNGLGVNQSHKEAMNWFLKAVSNNNDPSAQNSIGYMYKNGFGVKQDYNIALEWYTKSGLQGNPDGQYNIAMSYYDGTGTPRDYKQALIWFLKLAESEESEFVQFYIGHIYEHGGYGIEQDHVKSLEWYTKSADQGNSKARYNLGLLYLSGKGTPKDFKKALYLFKQVINEKEGTKAQSDIGYLYQQGGYGILQDYSLALQWYTTAANQGSAHAAYNLGIMYYYGHGSPENHIIAMSWFQRAIDNNNHPKAQRMMGLMHQHGHATQKDYTQALTLFTYSANQGNSEAQVDIGLMHLEGLGVDIDYEEAMNWFEKANENDSNPKAQYNIGVMFHQGLGVQPSYEMALKWYKKSAEQGDEESKNNILMMVNTLQDPEEPIVRRFFHVNTEQENQRRFLHVEDHSIELVEDETTEDESVEDETVKVVEVEQKQRVFLFV